MKQTYTPGPWRWEFNKDSKDISLVGGKIKYDLTVMDFVRYGMGGAAPRFNIDHGNDHQIMHRADEMGIIVEGREHHANWFQNISHPDAQLIAAAPELLECVKKISLALDPYGEDGHYLLLEECLEVIQKATNPDYKPDASR